MSAASYEARKFGVHSAMPLRTAGRLCPQGVFLPVDGRKYQQASREVMAILRRFTPQVQPISIDEAFLDVTASRALFGDGPEIAQKIKDAVRDEVGLTASVGVAATKLVAKVASDLRKPDGLVVVPPGEEASFLAPLPISRLWGVGEKTAASLLDYGVRTIGDLAALDPAVLERRFGKHGAALVGRAHGIDPDPVAAGEPAKSIGHEHTFDVDTSDAEIIERTILGMADGVAWRLRASGLKAVTITIKLRDSGFNTITRQVGLDVPADLTEPIYEAALALVRQGAPRPADPARRRDGVELPGAGPAGAVRRRGSEAAPGGRGAGHHPAQVRRPGGDPRPGSCGPRFPRPSSGTR